METIVLTCIMEKRNGELEIPSPSRRKTWKKRGKVLIIIGTIIIVCAVVSIPAIYHFVPQAFSNVPLSSNETITSCQTKIYSNMASPCYSILQQFQNCLNLADSEGVYILQTTDTANSDSVVGLVSLALSSGSSDICKEELIPFMCLYLLPICDEHGEILYPSSQDCLYISTDACQVEWKKAIAFGEGHILPKCSTFPAESLYATCLNDSDVPSVVINTTEVQCPDDFYAINNTCRPRCDRWVTNKGVVLEISVLISGSVGIICGIVFCAITVHQRRAMFAFPKVLIVYITADTVLLSILALINYTDRNALFCTSPDLITSISHPSTFCNVSGAAFMFLLLHTSLLWFGHVVAMFTKIKWPLGARKIALAGYYKYLHTLCLLASTIVSTLPVAVVLNTSGFATFTFPPLFCTPTNREVTFYCIILPVSILIAIGASLLIVILWIIHQHNHNLLKESSSELTLTFSERKLFLTFCYYIVFGTMTLAAFCMSAKNVEQYASELGQYFLCSEAGVSHNCQNYKDMAEALMPLELAIMAYILLGLFPAVNLMYTIRIRSIIFHVQSFVPKGCVTACKTKTTTELPHNNGYIVQNKISNECSVIANTGEIQS